MLVSSQSPFVVYDAVVRSDYRQEHASPEERKAVLSARQVELEPVVPTPVSLGAGMLQRANAFALVCRRSMLCPRKSRRVHGSP